MWQVTVVVAVAVALVPGVFGYQPYQYSGLQHRQSYNLNDPAALQYQKQILQWQQAVGQRAPVAQATLNSPWASREFADYRQDNPEGLPPQPTIVAPFPPGHLQTEAVPTSPPLLEVDNQLGGEATGPPPTASADPLRALCKAPRGQFPGTSCGKFVNCWDDVVVEQDCPLGLYFNEVGGYCDYPFNVACVNQPGQHPGGVSGPVGVGGPGPAPGAQEDLGSPGARCPTEYGTYRSTKNCGVFYMCVGYLPFEFTCPSGLNFHKDLQVCDYPYRVECNGVPSNQPPPEVTTISVGETTYPPPPGPPAEPGPPTSLPELPAPSPVPVDGTSFQPVASPEPTPAVAPPAVVANPEAFYNQRRFPPSLADSGVPCRANTVYRLNPACSSVAVCRNGYTQVLNCGPGTAYDTASDRCVSFLRARC